MPIVAIHDKPDGKMYHGFIVSKKLPWLWSSMTKVKLYLKEDIKTINLSIGIIHPVYVKKVECGPMYKIIYVRESW